MSETSKLVVALAVVFGGILVAIGGSFYSLVKNPPTSPTFQPASIEERMEIERFDPLPEGELYLKDSLRRIDFQLFSKSIKDQDLIVKEIQRFSKDFPGFQYYGELSKKVYCRIELEVQSLVGARIDEAMSKSPSFQTTENLTYVESINEFKSEFSLRLISNAINVGYYLEVQELLNRVLQSGDRLLGIPVSDTLHSKVTFSKVVKESVAAKYVNIAEFIGFGFAEVDGKECYYTVGMDFFNLPDLLISEISRAETYRAYPLLLMVSQHLYEGLKVDGKGALEIDLSKLRNKRLLEFVKTYKNGDRSGKGKIFIEKFNPEEVISQDYMRLRFLSGGKSQTKVMNNLFDQIFGIEEIQSSSFEIDEVLASEIAKVQLKLPFLKDQFKKGKKVYLCASLDVGNIQSVEWLWLQVQDWGSGPVTGVLTQDSSNPDIQTGRQVSAGLRSIVDYVIEDEEGNEIGPFTNKILNERLERQGSDKSD